MSYARFSATSDVYVFDHADDSGFVVWVKMLPGLLDFSDRQGLTIEQAIAYVDELAAAGVRVGRARESLRLELEARTRRAP